jgi:hypothetical protein
MSMDLLILLQASRLLRIEGGRQVVAPARCSARTACLQPGTCGSTTPIRRRVQFVGVVVASRFKVRARSVRARHVYDRGERDIGTFGYELKLAAAPGAARVHVVRVPSHSSSQAPWVVGSRGGEPDGDDQSTSKNAAPRLGDDPG